MPEPRNAWEDVADSLAELGQVVRERLATSPDAGDRAGGQPGGQPDGRPPDGPDEQPSQERAEEGQRDPVEDVMTALAGLTGAARRLGERAVDTVTDREMREGVQRVAERLGSALESTVDELDHEVRTYVQARRNQREQRNWGDPEPADSEPADSTPDESRPGDSMPEESRPEDSPSEDSRPGNGVWDEVVDDPAQRGPGRLR